MSALSWIQKSERVVGRNSTVYSDTLNRAARDILTRSGYNPDADPFLGLHKPVVNVKAFGATGDGVTNDAAAIQAAITAAGVGGHVQFPYGRYNCGTTTLVGQNFQRWEGSYQLGTGGLTGTDQRTALLWASGLGAGNGVTAGINQLFDKMLFLGTGKTSTTGSAISQGTALQSNHSKYLFCQFYDWGRGLTITNGFYASFDTCEWARCTIDVYADTCYNMHFVNCTARCWDNVVTNTGGVHVDAVTPIRHLHIMGGSIEGFSGSGAIILASSGSLVTLDGVYFESSVAGANAFGVDVRADGNTVYATGCLVYLTELNRWINMSGRDKCVLVSRGNHFVCANTSTSNPIAYVLPNNTTGGFCDVGPDNWNDVALAGANYVSSINAPIANACRLVAPKQWTSSNLKDIEVNGRPLWLVAQSAAPGGPITGTLLHADKTNFNPCGFSSGDPYLAFWDSTRWQPVSRPTFVGSKVFDPLSIAANTFVTAVTTIAVTGARAGDEVKVLFSLDTQGTYFRGRVTANDLITVDHDNRTGGAIDLASGTITAVCVRY